jgi:hypothetical protein
VAALLALFVPNIYAGAVGGPQSSIGNNPVDGTIRIEFKADEIAAVSIWVPRPSGVHAFQITVLDPDGKTILSQEAKTLGVVAWSVKKRGVYTIKLNVGTVHYTTN